MGDVHGIFLFLFRAFSVHFLSLVGFFLLLRSVHAPPEESRVARGERRFGGSRFPTSADDACVGRR
jgi:hypothetical protein